MFPNYHFSNWVHPDLPYSNYVGRFISAIFRSYSGNWQTPRSKLFYYPKGSYQCRGYLLGWALLNNENTMVCSYELQHHLPCSFFHSCSFKLKKVSCCIRMTMLYTASFQCSNFTADIKLYWLSSNISGRTCGQKVENVSKNLYN